MGFEDYISLLLPVSLFSAVFREAACGEQTQDRSQRGTLQGCWRPGAATEGTAALEASRPAKSSNWFIIALDSEGP